MLKRLLREPLLHFALLGVAAFMVYGYILELRGEDTSANEIRLSLDDLAQLEIMFESQWRRPPTAEEFTALVENRIREDVLYREALAMGLDKNDTIVKRRMAQKMQFLAEDAAVERAPTREELRAWFQANADDFGLPPRISFRHLYFSGDRRTAPKDDAMQALAGITGEPEDSPRADAVGDPFMFQDYYGDRTSSEIAREFGPEFAEAVMTLAPGTWQGPVKSGYGWHLVFVDSLIPGRIPAFEEVEPDVKVAWLDEKKSEAWRAAYEAMRAKYTISLPAPPEEAIAAAAERASGTDTRVLGADTVARDDPAPL